MRPYPSPFLRMALLTDAVASGLMGLLMAAGAGLLAGLLGLPEALLRFSGLFLVPFALGVAYLGTREMPARPAVWAVVALNLAWSAASLLLVLEGWVRPNPLGFAFVVFQAAVVLAFALMQVSGLRGSAIHPARS